MHMLMRVPCRLHAASSTREFVSRAVALVAQGAQQLGHRRYDAAQTLWRAAARCVWNWCQFFC
jgi:hypothetical protein